jgi:hypothetical protein
MIRKIITAEGVYVNAEDLIPVGRRMGQIPIPKVSVVSLATLLEFSSGARLQELTADEFVTAASEAIDGLAQLRQEAVEFSERQNTKQNHGTKNTN